MTAEEMNRILGVDPSKVWMPDYDFGEISEEENEELTHLLESLTEDDLKIAQTRVFDRWGNLIEDIVYDV